MSNSVFTEHPSAEGDNGESKVDSNLIVFINKNGSVSVDQAALQDLLVTDAVESKTSVTVLRVGSPTPSLELEIEEEEKAKKEAAAAEHSSSENEDDTGKDDKENHDDDDDEEEEDSPNQSGASRKTEDIKHVSVTIENFFMPQEAKQLAADILNVAGITNPLQICVDYDYQRLVISNDHCYTPFTSPSQRKSTVGSTSNLPSASSPGRRDLSASIRSIKTKQIKLQSGQTSAANNNRSGNSERTTETNLAKKVTTTAAPVTADDASADEDDDNLSADEDDENTASDSTYISPSESENDRDSDLDFNLNDRQSRIRKVPTRAKRLKQQQKFLTARAKKRQESSQDTTTLVDDSNSTKKRPLKTAKRRPTTSTSLSNKGAKPVLNRSNKPSKSDTTSNLTKEADALGTAADTSKATPATQTETTKPSEATPTISLQPLPKKDRKPPAHVEALMSDMTSLFSTPDIIKKVNIATATSTIVTPTLSVANTTAPTIVTTNKPYFMSQPSIGTTNKPMLSQQPPPAVASRNNDLASEQDKQLELIDSIVQQDLKEASPTKATSMNADIPKIVKMLECPGTDTSFSSVPATTTVSTPVPTSSTSLAYTSSGVINTELLDDSDLLAGLGNADDTGLTEDLLQHVAKLVQDKNLQEVIDKQVLGVEPTVTAVAKPLSNSNEVPTTTSATGAQLLMPEQSPKTIVETKSLVTTNTGKEPIKIIRSNGRVITLPPIEAPTTRGAKRRAQSQPTAEQDTKRKAASDKVIDAKMTQPAAKAAVSASAAKSVTTPKSTSKAKDRRSAAQRKAAEVTPVKVLDEGDDEEDDEDFDEDDDSDGTYNSEDDPNRLWCICRQPHNNRFMICCDKCEEWFHGKCVNVTRAMGMEMERQGIEWMCPNCLKKEATTATSQPPPIVQQPPIVQRMDASQPILRKQQSPPPVAVIVKQQPKQSATEVVMASTTPTTTTVKKTKPLEPIGKTSASKAVVPSQTDAPVIQPTLATVSKVSSVILPNVDSSSLLCCIVCKKPARQSSIYCSDDCIRMHATATGIATAAAQQQKNLTALNSAANVAAKEKKATTSKQTIKPKTILLPSGVVLSAHNLLRTKNERIVVRDKKTGRVISGNNAPNIVNLKQWLQAHPTFEPIPDDSEQAIAIKARQQKIDVGKSMAAEKTLFAVTGQKVQTTLKVGPTKKLILMHSQNIRPVAQQQQQQQPNQQLQQSLLQQERPKVVPKITKITKIPAQVALKPGSPLKSAPPTKLQITPVAIKQTVTSKSPATPTKTPMASPTKQSATITMKTPTTTPKPVVLGASTKTPTSQQQHQQPQSKRKQTPTDGSQSAKPLSVTKGQTEPVRANVQRTLKEQIKLRCAEECNATNCPKLSDDEIAKFVRDTESEIYYLFNKDTGTKYRAKYRSLIFNITDRKNQTLFQKICNKAIAPKQLVRMSPEELASQELALWRENENKHQLEMIKKSELDLLACAKSYVLKTHKGEEVMESKTSDRVTLDPSVSVEDVVSVLNNSTVSSTSEQLNDSVTLSPVIVKDTRIDSRFDKYLSVDSSSATLTKTTTTAVAASSSSSSVATGDTRKKETRRSRSRSRDRSQKSSKHKRKHSRERRSRSRERDKSRSDERSSGSGRDKDRESKSKRDDRKVRERVKSSTISSQISGATAVASKTHSKENSKSDGTPSTVVAKEQPTTITSKKEDNSHLIDKILEAQSTFDSILGTAAATIVEGMTVSKPKDSNKISAVDTEAGKTTTTTTTTTPNASADSFESPIAPVVAVTAVKKAASSESDQEPSSTVTIPTPPEQPIGDDEPIKSECAEDSADVFWTGAIVMPDVATFQMTVKPFNGICASIQKEFPDELEVVGRISPDTVWDYISKIKRTTKEVLVIRLGAETLDDQHAYYTLFRCLATRKRLGVIKSISQLIKDFYIFPLARHKSMPSVLLPLNSSTAVFEDDRPDLLFGIIVKFPDGAAPIVPTKRSAAPSTSQPPIKIRVTVEKSKTRSSTLADDQRYTPPSSPKIPTTKLLTQKIPLPVLSKEKVKLETPETKTEVEENDDGDEPYSPGDSDDDDDDVHFVMPPTVTSLPMASTPPKQISTTATATTVPISPSQMEQDEIQRKVDEINRQIEESKMQIAGMLLPDNSRSASMVDEPYSPTSAPLTKSSMPTLANISIPSNLQEILNSIKNVSSTLADSSTTLAVASQTIAGKMTTKSTYGKMIVDDDDEEYTPAPISAPSYAPTIDYIPSKTISTIDAAKDKEPSKLARLTDEELLSMVPDDVDFDLPPVTKKSKYSSEEPPPPGLEEEYVP